MSAVGKKTLYNALYAVAVIGIALTVWAVAAAIVDIPVVLPSVGETFTSMGDVFSNAYFWSGLGGTMLRCVIGFAISAALFYVLFRLSVIYRGFGRIIAPFISALRSLPAVAITLILSLLVGGYGAPVVLGVLVIMPMMYSAAFARVATVPTELVEVCRLCGATGGSEYRALWLPTLAAGLPEILSTAFSYNIKTVIGAEILAQTADSLGMLMKLSQLYLETPLLVAFVIVSVVLSVLCEAAIRFLLKPALRRYAD